MKAETINRLAAALDDMRGNVDVSTINNSKRTTARWIALLDRADGALAEYRAAQTIEQKFIAAGFHFEDFLGVWMRHAGEKCITVSDGQSINGHAYEVQVSTDSGESLDIGGEDDNTPDTAIALALAVEVLP